MKFLHRLTPVAVALGAIALAGAVHAADTIKSVFRSP